MKTLCSHLIRLTVVMLLAGAGAAMSAQVSSSQSSSQQDGRIITTHLDTLATKASDSVNLNIDERMMQISARFLSGDDPDEERIKQLVSGLKGLYVRRLEFDADNQYGPADIEPIRAQLRSPIWTRMVGVQNKKEGSVEVYLMMNGNVVSGLTLLSAEPRELTIVNILGPIDLDKLSELEGHLGIPELGLERAKPRPRRERNQEEDEEQ